MKFSSSFKVGALTLVAIIILVFSILWIKGRSISVGQRITVNFHDINGMRAGSSVQMMGYRIGQIEEVTPVIDGENSYVKVKFVITEPNIHLLTASEISIQQSGIIGEQFLEITPPRIRHIYIPILKNSKALSPEDKVEISLSDEMHDIGFIKTLDIIDVKTLPLNEQDKLKTKFAYKVGYVVTMPGLILPEYLTAKPVIGKDFKKLRLLTQKGVALELPKTESQYTIIEPLRLSDFMELQYRAAASLSETNERISTLLSDDVITSLKSSVDNINTITKRANTTLEKAELLIDSSKDDIEVILANMNKISNKFNKLTEEIYSVASDKDFQKTVVSTTKSVDRLAKNINKILENPNSKYIFDNLETTSKNIADISSYVNDMTKDEKLKKDINNSVNKFNKALDELSVALETVNNITDGDKELIKDTIEDASVTTKNLRVFSEKLNKRFLLFRLMF